MLPPLCDVCAVVVAENLLCQDSSRKKAHKVSKIITGSTCHDISDIKLEKVVLNGHQIPSSVFKNLPRFCTNDQSDGLDYGVFTDEVGNRVYMYAIEFKNYGENNNFKLCFISSFQLFSLMKDVLQTLSFVCASTTSIEAEVQNLLSILSNIFIPPKGLLDVIFNYGNRQFCVQSPIVYGLCDVPLALPFIYFDHKTIIEVIVCILTEQQVLFVCDDVATRLLVIECFLAFIYPMEWIAPYLPVLIEELYGFLGAMGFFVFGSNSNVMEDAKHHDNIVIVNIDRGTINYGKNSSHFEIDGSIISSFKQRLPKKSLNHFSSMINRIFGSSEELLMSRDMFDSTLNLRIFLSVQLLNLDLFEGLLDFQSSSTLKQSKVRKPSGLGFDHMSPIQLHLRDTMMRSSLKSKMSNPYISRQYLINDLKPEDFDTLLGDMVASLRKKDSVLFCSDAERNMQVLREKLLSSNNISIKCSLSYLQASILIQSGEIVEGFQCLHQSLETTLSDFPSIEVSYLLQRIKRHPKIDSQLKSQPFMKQAIWAPFFNENLQERSLMNIFRDSTFTYLEVPEILLQIGVTRKYEVAKKIFSVLKSDLKSGNVYGQDLKKFCELWKCITSDLDHTFIPLLTGQNEKIVKIAKGVRDGASFLSLVCSTDKIYFFDQLSGHVCDFLDINEIVRASISHQKLVFHLRSSKRKTVHQIHDALTWTIIIEELIGANSCFKITKDRNALVDARANILIYEALTEFDKQNGELIQHEEASGGKSSFFANLDGRHFEFLTFRIPETQIKNRGGNQNILHRFSPDSGLKESIEVVLDSGSGEMFIATRMCNVYKVSHDTLTVLDHVSLRLTTNDRWLIYGMVLIDRTLWVTLSYNKIEESIGFMDCDDLSSFRMLKLKHSGNIVGMRNTDEFCFITSTDGTTSKWSTVEKECIATINLGEHPVLSTALSNHDLIHSVKGGLFIWTSQGSIIHINTGFTLSKLTVCNDHVYGIDRLTPAIIRCFAVETYEHRESLDVVGFSPTSDLYSFSTISHYGDTHLICASRDCSLHVYSLSKRCFVKNRADVHTDIISAVSTTKDGKIITGARSKDGTVIIWTDMLE